MTPSTTPATGPTTPDRPRPGGSGRLGVHTVSRIGYGAMQLRHLHADRDAALALVRRAVDLGVDHIDTAQFYGDGLVNELIREALHGQDGVTVVTKVGAVTDASGALRPAQRPEELRASVEENLTSLGVDELAIVNLRRLDAGHGLQAEAEQIVDLDDQLAELTAMRAEGKIGEIGLSGVTLDVLTRALPAGIACVQNAYSLVDRSDEDMLELCAAEGIAWVPFFPLGSEFPHLPKVTDQPAVRAAALALGCTPSQVGLAWLLQLAPNVLLIPGTTSTEHLEENLSAGMVTLDDATLATLERGSRP